MNEKTKLLSNDRHLDGERVTAADRALLDAAAGKGGDVVELTSQLLKQIGDSLAKRAVEEDREFAEILAATPERTKLAVVAWAMRAIVAHAREGGSFRYLIYERLGFGPEAYVPLYTAGGMTISNELDLSGETPPEKVLENLLAEIGVGSTDG